MGLVGSLVACTAANAEPPRLVGARLGLGNHYKLGCWAPLRVTIDGGSEPLAVNVVAVTPDSDGVGVATTSRRPLSTEPGRTAQARLFVRVGQRNSPIELQLFDGARRIGSRLFTVESGNPDELAAGASLPLPTDSTTQLVLQAGAEVNVGDVVAAAIGEEGLTGYEAPVVTAASDLPINPLGYDSFNTVILVASASEWLAELTPGDQRVRALVDWVESGGRLVLSCGSAGPTLLEADGPLATFLPGEYLGPQTLSVATPIESYAEAAEDAGSLALSGGTLTYSELGSVRGVVEAYAGRNAKEGPLVVRSPRGFGEVTFVAFDLDAPAVAGWKGRSALVRELLRLPVAERATQEAGPYYDGYQRDLINQLLERLDNAFAGVRTAPFLLIVGLVVLYLLLIGPGDYLFVRRVLGRVEATWVTFPLIVLGTSVAAYAGAYWLKGDRLRVNQVEIVDVESSTGRTRGLLLTHLFSPRAERYSLALQPRTLGGETPEDVDGVTAWLGKPGGGLGGMQSFGDTSRRSLRADYELVPTAGETIPDSVVTPSVVGLPVQVWSTKSLVSRWGGVSNRAVEASLTPDGDGLVEGSLTNDCGVTLLDCRLLYGAWAWKLGKLIDGETVAIDPSRRPLKIKSLLNENRRQPTGVPGQTVYVPNASSAADSIEDLADSFSVGLSSSDGLSSNGYLHDADLTHHLDAGRALLLARVASPCSELLRVNPKTGEPEPLIPELDSSAEPSRKTWVFARFILNLEADN